MPSQSVPIPDLTNVIDHDKMDDIDWLSCAGQLENILADLTECSTIFCKLKTEALPNPIIFILESVQIISKILNSKSKEFLKNSNIVLEQFSESTATSSSNNIIDEFINHDPGCRGPIISTSQRQYLIALGPQ